MSSKGTPKFNIEQYRVDKDSPDYQVGYMNGYNDGFDKGRQEGYEHGKKVGKKQAFSKMKELNNNYEAITIKGNIPLQYTVKINE